MQPIDQFEQLRPFGHSYEDIGLILDKRPENCRQIFSRAKKALEQRKPPHQIDPSKARSLLSQMMRFAEEGRYEALTRLFVKEAQVIADGGGKVRGAIRNVLHGADKAARFILGATGKLRPEDAYYEFREINGGPALVGISQGKPFLVLSISHDGEGITALYVSANPDKLRFL